MTVIVDTNVLVDMFTKRQPHYADSALFLSQVFAGVIQGVCASHCMTTVYYILQRHADIATADKSVNEILNYMDVLGLHKSNWRDAQSLGLPDFEDSAVAVTASLVGASFIVTRNLADFIGSPVPAITPSEFMRRFLPPP